MTKTDRGRDLSAPDRPASFCPTCLPAVVIDMGRAEIAHEARCPAGRLDHRGALSASQGAVQTREGAS